MCTHITGILTHSCNTRPQQVDYVAIIFIMCGAYPPVQTDVSVY